MKTCKNCGREIGEFDMDFLVNPGLPSEYVECEICHDYSCNNGKVVMCEACGNYFSSDVLKDEQVKGCSFTACPSCGRDVVDGLTRKEFEEENYVPKYSVMVQYQNGAVRGYVIVANDRNDLIKRMTEKIDFTCATSVQFAEILMDEDEF